MNLPIKSATIIINEDKCRQNIKSIADKAERSNMNFRPHFKTHQSRTIGRWFRDFGVTGITVSSLQMAEYFALDGWDDITVAIPVNLHQLALINRLASSIKLNLLVESMEVLEKLDSQLRWDVGIFIKIDTGYGRTGIKYTNQSAIKSLVDAFINRSHCTLKGFLTHAGNTYSARSSEGILNIHNESMAALKSVYDHMGENGGGFIYSMGDTPSCSVASDFGIATEMRPGNAVFYDLSQWQIGSSNLDQISMAIACPVIAKHSDRNEIIIHGGGIHFSKDRLYPEGSTSPLYGLVTSWNGNKWSIRSNHIYLQSISQEHGTIKADEAYFNDIQIGDFIPIIPVHSCMAADLMRYVITTDSVWIRE